MKFLDLHAHPVCKTLFNDFSPWDFFKASDRLLGNILENQTNLRQIITGDNCNLICMTLSPVEVGILDNWLMYLVPLFTNALNRTYMDRMINGEDHYYKLLFKEKENLEKPPAQEAGEQQTGNSNVRPIHILKSFSEYIPNDFSKLYVFFNIEGGHTFYNPYNSTVDVDQIIANYTSFVTRKEHLVFYITPAHLTPNIFITHAYGNKILAKGKLMPRNIGITKTGMRFLKEIVETGLLIDVKHMSLISRQYFYQMHKYNWKEKPMLCSHAGITGCSWRDKLNRYDFHDHGGVLHKIKRGPGFVKVRYIKPAGILKGTYFNPCSINLYDEDIVAILEVKGLIGLILDLRILGGERNLFGNLKLTEKEFVSEQEFEVWEQQAAEFVPTTENDFESPYPDVTWINGELSDDIWDEEDVEEELEELNGLSNQQIEDFYRNSLPAFPLPEGKLLFKERPEEHLRFFVNQIFHVIRVVEKAKINVDPWKHICIGSDFDGYIRAIDSCRNIARLNSFGALLIEKLPALADEATITLPRAASTLIEDILFNNAYQFATAHFNQQQGFDD